MLTLSPGLEALQPLLDAIFDPLVVAGLEMQAMEIAAGAPVAAIQSLTADKEDGDRDRLRGNTRDLEHQFIGHGRGNALEEIEIQIGLVTVSMKGVGIEAVNRSPQGSVHVPAMQGIELDAGFGDAAALSFRLLAFLRREGGEEAFKRIIAVVVPVKLAVAAQYQPGAIEIGGRVFGGKQHVPGGHALVLG